MRAVWKGSVSFGLISIPVRLFRATEERDVSFHQVRVSDGSRIKYKRVAAADGEEVSYADIAKGYELPGGETVILTDADLEELPLTTSRAIEVDAFVPLAQVDPIYFEKTYYLEPEGQGALKPYALLRDALVSSERVAIVKVALRRREQLAALRVRDGVFVLETMLWPDEIRPADFDFLGEDVTVRPQELAMATSLIDSLAGDFDPTQYTDAYREAVEQVVAAKVEGREVVTPPGVDDDEGGEVLDLMAALRASVAAAKKARGAEAEEVAATTRAAKPPAGRSAAKSSTRKTAAKTATAKKAPAKKAAAKNAASTKTAATKTAAKKTAAKGATKSTATRVAKKASPGRKSA